MVSVIRTAEFAAELHRRRTEAGMTLSAFAASIFYSKGYLSRVENGLQSPSEELARACDAELGAGGALTMLVREAWAAEPLPDTVVMPLPQEPSILPADLAVAARGGDLRTLYDAGFAHSRLLGHGYSPRIALADLLPQARVLTAVVAETRDPEARGPLVRLLARQQEYAGWMFQEHGDHVAASSWTAAAGHTAAAVQDRAFWLWTLLRHAEISLYQGDALRVLELSGRVSAACRDDYDLAAAAERIAAQGRALEGDPSTCLRCLDRSAAFVSRASAGATIFGSTSLLDPLATVRGWVAYELGQLQESAEILEGEVSRMPAASLRSRARFGVRAALAYSAAGELDRACAVTEAVLDSVERTRSATIALDVRRLSRSFLRRAKDPRVSRLLPRLHAASRVSDGSIPSPDRVPER
jgi:transcriptional regulator with XRE-family HTH domain